MAFIKKKQKHPVLKSLALPVLSFAAVASLVIAGVGSMSQTADEQLLSAVRQAVVRASVQCYALEGEYPPSLDYLRENYGLSFDPTKYVVHYQNIGGNLMPQINVFPLLQS